MGTSITGKNPEAVAFIVFIVLFVGLAIYLSIKQPVNQSIGWVDGVSTGIAFGLLSINLMIAGLAVMELKDSWRIGVLFDQDTQLVVSGIYSISRNPYFLSYILLFIAFSILLKSTLLMVLTVPGLILIHRTIKREEDFLKNAHGSQYTEYLKRVPRYLIF